MTTHLSVRLCWHDSGWNGHVCKQPTNNKFCIALPHIRESKNEEAEEEIKCKCLSDVAEGKLNIPCKADANVFSDKSYKVTFKHGRHDWNIPDTTENFGPYTFCPGPYRWMQYSEYDRIRKKFKLNLRDLDSKSDKTGAWIGDVKLQKKLLDTFWGHIEEKKSLVVFYANSAPVLEDTKRIIVGIGRISKKGKICYYGTNEEHPGPNPVWQRRIQHNYPEEGFRLPYQEYIEQGADPTGILLTTQEDFADEFKYVTEHVTNGTMLAIVEQLRRIIDQIQSDVKSGRVKLTEDWEKHKKWIQKIIGELWDNRGQYPGIGGVLQFLGFNRGMTYHRQVLKTLERQNENILLHVVSILDGKKEPESDYGEDFANTKIRWGAYSGDINKKELLELLMRFEINEDQVERIVKENKRRSSGIECEEHELINNPYLITELDEGEINEKGEIISKPIVLDIIDQAMLPSFNFKGKYRNDDDRRVRAIMVEELEKVADEGDTLLDIQDIVARIRNRFPLDRVCDPDIFLIKANKAFYEERVEFIGKNGEFIALRKYRDYEKIASRKIRELIAIENKGKQPNWPSTIHAQFGDIEKSKLEKETERRARKEKGNALRILFSRKFSVLTGRAGTGKTEVLSILIRGLIDEGENPSDFLILAPTGKARVRISRTLNVSGLEPQTIHQHLSRNGWLDKHLRFNNEGRKAFAKNIIIDECSMIAIDLFATLIESIDFSNVTRFILVGDPNQLPPIGPGRPFDDIVKWLNSDVEYGHNIVNLEERVRQKIRDSVCLKLADGFLRDYKSKDIEEVYSLVEQNKLQERDDLYVGIWKTPEELIEKIDETLSLLDITDYESYKKSVGINDREATKCESWQILSPVKQKEVSGTIPLNAYLQEKFLSDTIQKWREKKYYNKGRRYPKPFGRTKDIVHEDKVIQTRNTTRLKSYPDHPGKYVANGEIGIVRFPFKGPHGILNVKFSDQPLFWYTYYNGEGEQSVEINLELAYAITIHKSQGSDFDSVIIIIPERANTISMEMMYTALTRFREKTYLLVQNSIDTLEKYRHASSSETDRRNTYLFKIVVRDDVEKIPFAENRIHRTKQGFLVRSKSEVIIANELINAGITLTEKNYEKRLNSKDTPYDYKLPDFTFSYKGKEYFWEHLGMLGVESYKESWERKLKWYEKNMFESQLITSKDGLDGSIDSKAIDRIIEEELGIKIKRQEFHLKDLEEDSSVEFKSSVSWDYKTKSKNKKLEEVIAKTISAFMNSYGGMLIIGANDKKEVLGIDNDLKLLKKQDEDGFQLKIIEIVSNLIGKEFTQLLEFDFRLLEGKKIAIIAIGSANEPCFVNETNFYIRTGNSTQPLNQKESHNYIKKHWG